MKIVTLKINVRDVIYDIRNKAWLLARARDNGTNFKQVAYMKPDSEGGDNAQLLQAVAGAWYGLRPLFGEYVVGGGRDPEEAFLAATAPLHNDDELTAVLTLPENFNETVSAALADNVHKYIVAQALAEWLRLNVADDATAFFTEAQMYYNTIWANLAQRIRPERPRVSQV